MTTGGSGASASVLPGLGLAILVAAVSHLISLGRLTPDPHMIAILISILLGNLIVSRRALQPGIAFSQAIVVPLGIVLYGTQVDLQPLQEYGIGRVILIVVMVLVCIIAVHFAARRMQVAEKKGLLIAGGTALCGASAIIILSPVVLAEKKDTSVALLAITVMGICGVILYPVLQGIFSLREDLYTLLCATTLPQMGQVKAAVSIVDQDAVAAAVSLKLIRVAMILPVAVLFSLLTRHAHLERSPGFPWFIVGFVGIAAAVNAFPFLDAARSLLSSPVSFIFTVAIAGIGLSIDLESIIESGPKPLVVSFVGWAALVLVLLAGTAVL